MTRQTDTVVGSGTIVDRVVAELAALHTMVEQILGLDSGRNWLAIVLVIVGVGLGTKQSGETS